MNYYCPFCGSELEKLLDDFLGCPRCHKEALSQASTQTVKLELTIKLAPELQELLKEFFRVKYSWSK